MHSDLRSFVHRLKALKIQGAKEIAVASLKFLRHYDPKFGVDFNRAAKQMEAARPTAVVLHNCLETLRRERNLAAIDRLLAQMDASTEKISNAATFIKSGQIIMTHCHSGVAVAVLKHAWKRGKKIRVIATETEPKHQGIKTAKELSRAGIPVTLIVDSAVGYFMPQVGIVLLGSDALRPEGNVNKIGSYNIALAAKAHGKPYYVVASMLKIDKRKKIEIEERPPAEVYRKMKGVRVRNPAFDTTPWRYIKGVVTERGVKTPGQISRMIKGK